MKGKKLLSFALAFLVIAALIPAIATTAEAYYEEYVPSSYYPESAHPYGNNMDYWWDFEWPGATMLYVTFSDDCRLESSCDYLRVYDHTGTEIATLSGYFDGYYMSIAGDSFSLNLETDGSVTYYGFAIESIYADMPNGYEPSNPFPQSLHPYNSNTDETKSYTKAGAFALELTFSYNTYVEHGFDYIYLYDGNYNLVATYTGDEAAGETVFIMGDTFYVRLTSDSSVQDYGYAFSSITETSLRNGWTQVGDDWYHCANGVVSTGWKQISGTWYFFSANGKMATGWVEYAGETYFMRSSGAMATGLVQINGSWYFFDRNGVMYANEWLQSGSTWYYLKSNGEMATGVCKIGTVFYKFNGSGVWIPGGADGWGSDNGVWFYVSGGRCVTGWQKIGGAWYYFNRDGEMLTGWQTIGGQEYLLKSSGAMATGWALYEGEYYYFDANGRQKFGWQQVGGLWYYLDPDYGYMWTGWSEIGGYEYYLKSSGAMATGWAIYDGDYYYFDANGQQKFGWQKIGGVWYYLDPYYGYMYTGRAQIDYEYYYFASSGAMKTGWVQVGSYWYYFNNDGVQLFGEQTIGGKTYYLDYNYSGRMRTNTWYRVYDYYNGYSYYFFGEDGAMVKNQWKRIGNYDYYFDSNGKCDRVPSNVNWY